MEMLTLLTAFIQNLPEPLLLCDHALCLVAASGGVHRLIRLPDARRGIPLQDVLPPCPFLASPKEGQYRLEISSSRTLNMRAVAVPPGGWALYLHDLSMPDPDADLIGESAAIRELLEFVSRIAPTRASSILIEGESGSGKELIARRLHRLSPRASREFVAVNCAALPETLLESELFGHEKGAFTGAHSARRGLLEVADGGTLFLDEIGEMPLSLQAKLLRVLEDHTFRRVGGVQDLRVDLRVIAATNRDLKQAIQDKAFRSDLYYRLNVVQIHIPPLRERPEDIPLLAMHFVEVFSRRHNRPIFEISPDAIAWLESYRWPGNVRELRNVIERAVLVEPSRVITVKSLALLRERKGRRPASFHSPLSLCATERELIELALAKCSGNQTRAAALLGIGRFCLRYRMKKFGLL